MASSYVKSITPTPTGFILRQHSTISVGGNHTKAPVNQVDSAHSASEKEAGQSPSNLANVGRTVEARNYGALRGVLVTCEKCGDEYTIREARSRHRRLCITCRSVVAIAKGRESFTSPESTKVQKVRANGLVNKRRKLGWFTVPKTCMKCGTPARLDSHHTDYEKPDEVYWLCRSCHGRVHHDPSILLGIDPMKLDRTTPKTYHGKGGRRGPTGKPRKGRAPLRRIVSAETSDLLVIERLVCGHKHIRVDDLRRPVQRRCNDCRSAKAIRHLELAVAGRGNNV